MSAATGPAGNLTDAFMTSPDQAPRGSRVSWIDAAGGSALTALTAGAGILWGVGWALLTFGAVLGLVYLFTEMLLPARRPAERNRREPRGDLR